MQRTIEIFTAGCPLCEPVVQLVKETACDNCEVIVFNLAKQSKEKTGIDKIKVYGINRVPSIVVNGKLLDCCEGAITKEDLLSAGIGVSKN